MKILLAEDDRNLSKILTALLKKNNIIVDYAENGEAAYNKCYSEGYDVLVLDWMMPKLSGIELCKRLREEGYEGKILMLTAKDSIEDRVQGLNSGADDYLIKPFDVQELIARLNALARRHQNYSKNDLVYGSYILDRNTYSLAYGEKRVELRPREFKILELLMRNRGQIISREILQDRVWGINSDVTENNIDVHIRLLRKKILSIGETDFIRTVRGVGYYVE